MKTKLILISLAALFVGGLREQFSTPNVETAQGTHKILSLRADAAHSYSNLLIKVGSDSRHGAVCGAANYPIGITTDQPEAAEDLFNVTPLEIAETTRKVRVATAIAADVDLYTAANGFAQVEPTVAGTYYKIGRSKYLAVQAGTGDYLSEFVPRAPVKVVVIAALTSGQNATAAATDLTTTEALANALKADYNKLQTDYAAMAAALATPGEVKVLTS